MPIIQFKGKTAVENYHSVAPHHTLEIDVKLSPAAARRGTRFWS